MSMGAERAETQPRDDDEWTGGEAPAGAESDSFDVEQDTQEAPGSTGSRVLANLLVLLALGWLGFAGFALSLAWPDDSLVGWAGWAATVSAPLVLLALIWLIFGRASRREAERFTRAVAEMRGESRALEALLAIVAERLQQNRATLSEEAARLMALGDEASDRLGRVTHYLARETAELDRTARALDSAAASARTDIGVLMADLPRAEEQARGVAAAIRDAGLGAHEQAAALEAQLTALAARAREADEIAGGSAQRLSAQIARIETGTSAAAARMDEAAAQMNGAVDGAMGRSSEAIDRTRAGLEAQSEAVLAMIEQSRAGFAQTGAETSRLLSEQLGAAGVQIERIAERLSEQETASRALVAGLGEQLADLDRRLAALAQTGEERSAALTHAMAELRETAQALQRDVERGDAASDGLTGRARDMGAALSKLTTQLRDELPPALADVEAQAGRTQAAAQAAVPAVEAVQAASAGAASSLAESEASVARQRHALEGLLARIDEGVSAAQSQLRDLDSSLGEADGTAVRLAQETGPQLVEALVRVREAANQAATHARDAIAAAIPDAAAALAQASREAVTGAVTEPVQDQIADIAASAQRATAVARQASERLTRQLLAIGETAAAIEDRLAEERAENEAKAAETLTRRVSLLIEALNSTAIDVNKILSNEVADNAWAAYLKGDRGVFTRRAVRLLDSGEAREIERHYEEEPDFRDQVNRYVHDFESMLRRVLADREGATLGVTLLSSDMGKLYVALAQAIDRLRR